MYSGFRAVSSVWVATQHRLLFQYLQQSVIPTMHFQPSLPRLPTPKLEDTHRRYLDAQKPLLTSDEFTKCKEVTERFFSYEGRSLHAKLVEWDKNNPHTSYVADAWYDMYLKYRGSIVLTHDGTAIVKRDPTTSDQLVRATKVIHSALRFKCSLDDNVLEPSVHHLNPKKSDTALFRQVTRLLPSRISCYGANLFKAYPLDMSQYSRLFNSTRIPEFEKDRLYTDKEAKHLLVIKNGHYFVFDVYGNDGSILSMNAIYSNLKKICALSEEKSSRSLGVLTTENRERWASWRKELWQDSSNAAGLKLIEGALFALCLDENNYHGTKEANEMFLYRNPNNRWFDKSFQLIVSKNAELALHLEHSWGDGVCIIRFLNDINREASSCTFDPPKTVSADNVRKIDFNLTPSLASAINSAEDNYNIATSRLMFHSQKLEGVGRNYFKSRKVSPDAMFQLALQMAYFRLKGTAAPTYESCSTATFKHGRTETIRPSTMATLACCKALQKSHPSSAKEIKTVVREQSKYHKKLAGEAAIGQGFARHLLALKNIADKEGKMIDFFNDDAYVNIKRNILCTTTVLVPDMLLRSFGPRIGNGLGIFYMVGNDWILWNVTSYPESPNGADFTELVKESLIDVREILTEPKIKHNKSYDPIGLSYSP